MLKNQENDFSRQVFHIFKKIMKDQVLRYLIDRICFSCGEIEDEYHVVMCCTKYDDLRQKYLPSSLFKKPSMLKFINYLNCENKSKLKKLGIFLHWVYARYEKI